VNRDTFSQYNDVGNLEARVFQLVEEKYGS